METNQYYCRGGTHQTPSSSSAVSQPSTAKMSYGNNAGQEYVTCSSNQSEASFNSRDVSSRNGNNKQLTGNRNLGSPYAYSNCNSTGYCPNTNVSNNGQNAGNYINVMTVPLGTLQYNRKKSTTTTTTTTQDYQ